MTEPLANRVSIVIPVFNKRELTEACLVALRRHTPAGVRDRRGGQRVDRRFRGVAAQPARTR